ncbi:winged helix-turn-helix transcriptional regulator [Mucilaginibacter aquariorum]|uniref:Helix-turn-helix transcriptional regulator n=1 Tax=Mucilaginibacter aquariorum TaxID=2967225 RepID=A0ABT1SY82_9SPHI|nr:helix-turn-helix domain-containing protein [Mucilaginibacter aquariorum]MCQ6957237.1 helix-turn-helix transcriptional regulator [Mucilaginibacter aquariorum]
MKSITPRSRCPISFSLDILGDKWILLILRDMIFAGKSSYNEFLQSAEKIATNILADRLNILESQKLVEKVVASDKRSKFTYILTEKSITLIPVILELSIWGLSNFPPETDPDLIIALESDREETIKKYKELARKRAEQQRKSSQAVL